MQAVDEIRERGPVLRSDDGTIYENPAVDMARQLHMHLRDYIADLGASSPCRMPWTWTE